MTAMVHVLLTEFILLMVLIPHNIMQSVPVFDANGPDASGIDFTTTFQEGTDTNISIISLNAFIEQDQQPVVWITVNITESVRSSLEFLSFIGLPSSVLSVTGNNTKLMNISAIDLTMATADNFISVLLSMRYNNIASEPLAFDRVIEFTVSDGMDTNFPPARTVINVQRIPIADLNGPALGVNGRQEYIESSPPTVILDNLILIDPDSFGNITEARARIDTVFDMGNESIAFDSSLLPSGVTCSPASCNGTDIRISGTGTVPQYQRFLSTLQYVNLQQSIDLPNLRDRVVYVTVSDGVSTSDPDANILIDFIPANPRVIIELAAPNQNFVTTFEEDQLTRIPCTSNVRVVNTSIRTLESIVVSIRDNLPAGVEEYREMISLTSVTGLDISIEINTVLKRITFSQVAPVSQYVDAIQRVRYFNGEDEPYQINRFVDFLVIPGGGAPNDTAFCNITIENRNDNGPVCEPANPTVAVQENTSTNTIITTLVATDVDVGIDGEVFYTLVSGDEALFSVVSNGSVILVGGLDREMVDEYQRTVEACDMGTPQFCCIFNVTVIVTDANDTAFCNITIENRRNDNGSNITTTVTPYTTQNCELSSSNLHMCGDANILAQNLLNHPIQYNNLSTYITTLEYLTPFVITDENVELQENYLTAVDNLIQVDSEVISQSDNVSQRILTILNDFTDNVQLPNGINSTTFIKTSFAIRVDDIDTNQYSGDTFTINSMPIESTDTSSGSIDSMVTTINTAPDILQNTSLNQNVTAAVKIPSTIFEELGVNTSSGSLQRVSISSFTHDSLFQTSNEHLNKSNFTLGSTVVAVNVNGSTKGTILSTPIEIHFQLFTEIINSTLSCGIWQGSQEGWSSDSCKLIVKTVNGEVTAVVKYRQMGHFALLLAAKEDPLPIEYSLTLYTVTIVGLSLSLLCLMLFLITFPTLRKFRNSDHGGILVNMCIALACVYVVYLIAAHASSVRVLCITAAALLQYFFLVFFGWTTAEAFYLYRNLVVKVLGPEMQKFVLKVGAVVWLVPMVIVALSLGPGFKFYYADDHSFCRARGLPFWLGFILPFLIMYVFNWFLFFLIVFSLCRRHRTHNAHKEYKHKLLKENVAIAVGLAVLFGLGWGFGLAVSSLGNNTVNFVFQFVFVIFVGCQGVLIFALHGIKRADFRKQWKRWFYKVTGKSQNKQLVAGSTLGLTSRSTHNTEELDSKKQHPSKVESIDEPDNDDPHDQEEEDSENGSESSSSAKNSYAL